MPLSWNEIRTRAVAFSKDWEGESSEDAEAKNAHGVGAYCVRPVKKRLPCILPLIYDVSVPQIFSTKLASSLSASRPSVICL